MQNILNEHEKAVEDVRKLMNDFAIHPADVVGLDRSGILTKSWVAAFKRGRIKDPSYVRFMILMHVLERVQLAPGALPK